MAEKKISAAPGDPNDRDTSDARTYLGGKYHPLRETRVVTGTVTSRPTITGRVIDGIKSAFKSLTAG